MSDVFAVPEPRADRRPPLLTARQQALALDLLAVLIAAAVYAVSLWQSLYRFDPHHFGLMLSYAQDFCQGRVPYVEIAQAYGWLSTVVHGLAFCYGGQTLLTLSVVTIAFYAAGLLLLYVLAIRVTRSRLLAVFVLIIAAMVHPITVYPWPNYIAFPFLLLGLLALVREPLGWQAAFAGGTALGLAVLARENLLPAAVCIIGTVIFLDLLRPRGPGPAHLRIGVVAFGGLLAPLLAFFLYLAWLGALDDWYNLETRLLTVATTQSFSHMSDVSRLGLLKPMYWAIREGLLQLEPRSYLFALMILMNAGVLGCYLLGMFKAALKRELAVIATASLLLFSVALHIPETFRLATGSIVGLIPLFSVLRMWAVDRLALAFLVGAISPTLPFKNLGTKYVAGPKERARAIVVTTPAVLAGQRWQPDQVRYYSEVLEIFSALQAVAVCRFRYQYNGTTDGFITVISPFRRFQFAPMATGREDATGPKAPPPWRPDLELGPRLSAGDIILIRQINPDSVSLEQPPGYVSLRRIPVPGGDYYGNVAREVEFLVPAACSLPAESGDERGAASSDSPKQTAP